MKLENPYEDYAKLTEKERQLSYAKYYDRPIPEIPKRQQDILENGSRMTGADVISPGEFGIMLTPKRLSLEDGYCLMPDGSGFVAARHDMPEVSLAMYHWWNDWRMQGDSKSKYKIWCPGKHLACHNLFVSEEIGGEVEEIYFIGSVREHPELLGFTRQDMAQAGLLFVDGGSAWSKARSAPPDEPPVGGVVLHFLYSHPNGTGIIMRSRFWQGYSLGDNGLYRSLAPGQRVSEKQLRGLFEHNCLEMEYLNSLLPALYREETGEH